MGKLYIVRKNGKYQHTVSYMRLQKLKKLGWKLIAEVYGWNVGISFENDVRYKEFKIR